MGLYNRWGVSVVDYKEELDFVNNEIKLVDETIKYYRGRRNLLLGWKHSLEVCLGRLGDKDTCVNCRFYSNQYCSKFDFSVNDGATCDSFEWNEDNIDGV